MITSLMLVRQIPLLEPFPIRLTPLLRYSCKLFVALAKVKFFAIKQIHALCAKYRGVGYIRTKPSCRISNLQALASQAVCIGVTPWPAPRRSTLRLGTIKTLTSPGRLLLAKIATQKRHGASAVTARRATNIVQQRSRSLFCGEHRIHSYGKANASFTVGCKRKLPVRDLRI